MVEVEEISWCPAPWATVVDSAPVGRPEEVSRVASGLAERRARADRRTRAPRRNRGERITRSSIAGPADYRGNETTFRPKSATADSSMTQADDLVNADGAADSAMSDEGMALETTDRHEAKGVGAQTPGVPAAKGGEEAGGWRNWLIALVAVRDAVVLVPPLPVTVWGGGVVVLLLYAAVRVLRFRGSVRIGRPAPRSVLREVAAACETLKLRHAPQTLMVDGCLSPMISCGRRTRLVLPTRLWDDLDDVGRRAVLLHELAHLRRRDHWVLWAERIIGVLYWWHPLIWWVRRRLHIEADYCCDAWVTTLLPRTRRAYAEALLRTRQYVGEGNSAVPVLGMGVTTGRAKRFARRLTMVMTTSTKPGLTLPGVALVLADRHDRVDRVAGPVVSTEGAKGQVL